MYARNPRTGKVRFAVKPIDGAKKVVLCGTFNGWKPAAMRKQKDGSFAVNVNLPKGTYEYKFIIDGQWHIDPENDMWAANPYGSFNSVARITD
jgi:1,4-alpha-glucan branching enzyme